MSTATLKAGAVLRDAELRRALLGDLAPQLDADTLVVDELDLCGLTRVDVAVVNGHLSGFEIKGSTDSLRRLPGQVAVYSMYSATPLRPPDERQ